MKRTSAALVADRGPAGAPACEGMDPDVFQPYPSEPGNGATVAEREALEVCARCPVRDWCLERDLAECSTTYQVVGVRGGMRQADRRALHVQRFGVRAPRRAGSGR
ncbi:WhiB family transcriptional regulator [Streptomyces anulatus]